jgi:hypothetical protein
MIYKDIEFFNVEELEKRDELPGLVIQRFPANVRTNLGYKNVTAGRHVSQHTTGCEMRFVTSGKKVRIFLSALDKAGEVLVYKGDFLHSRHYLKPGIISTLDIEKPASFAEMRENVFEKNTFSPEVWRICFIKQFSAAFHGIDSLGYEIRPPENDEVPGIKWLAYGSSITQGAARIENNFTYIEQSAKRLGIDVLCKGMGGSCLCEKEMADYFAKRVEWDFATLELGINMSKVIETEEFKKRVKYMIDQISMKNPEKPVIIITVFPNFFDFTVKKDGERTLRIKEYRKILREVYSEMKHNNLHLIEGDEILTDLNGLTCDLIHPSDFGHIIMGQNLAAKIRNILYPAHSN